MARIIRFNPDRHHKVLELLPWYVTGKLEDEDRVLVETHLRDCAECQAELRLERRLAGAVAELPFDADQGWTGMRARILAQAEPRRPFRRLVRALATPERTGWALAAQFVLAVVIVGLALQTVPSPRYHALGAARRTAAGDAIVIFRPDANADALARAVRASGARIVDGPTAADAYVLDVPLSQRTAALARLRADAAVTLAEPIDPAEPR
jgi:hypothetical protein